MLKLIKNIANISATIRKVADTIHVGADAFDVLKKLNSIWGDEPTKELKENDKPNDIKEDENND